MKASYVEIQPNEPENNLVPLVRSKPTKDSDSIGRRALLSAMNDPCRHDYYHYGIVHFWGNPNMRPPCSIVKIDGVWYDRKSCDHIGPVVWNEDGSFEYETG